MAMTVAHLFEEALSLSDDSRIDIAERLIASARTPAALMAEQVRVASERMGALDEGRSSEISGPEAHELVRQAVWRN